MHGPEHWFGLARAAIIILLLVYGIWSLLDVIRVRVIGTLLGELGLRVNLSSVPSDPTTNP